MRLPWRLFRGLSDFLVATRGSGKLILWHVLTEIELSSLCKQSSSQTMGNLRIKLYRDLKPSVDQYSAQDVTTISKVEFITI